MLHAQFGPDRFATGLLCELHLPTGRFTWLPCGHPPPLLVRGTKVAEWAAPPRPPLGLGHLATGRSADHVQHRQLQPGDRLLLYTDGITEARKADGRQFGLDQLVTFIGQHARGGSPAPELLRRLTRAILTHHDDELSDDATIVQLQFRPDPPEALGPAGPSTP